MTTTHRQKAAKAMSKNFGIPYETALKAVIEAAEKLSREPQTKSSVRRRTRADSPWTPFAPVADPYANAPFGTIPISPLPPLAYTFPADDTRYEMGTGPYPFPALGQTENGQPWYWNPGRDGHLFVHTPSEWAIHAIDHWMTTERYVNTDEFIVFPGPRNTLTPPWPQLTSPELLTTFNTLAALIDQRTSVLQQTPDMDWLDIPGTRPTFISVPEFRLIFDFAYTRTKPDLFRKEIPGEDDYPLGRERHMDAIISNLRQLQQSFRHIFLYGARAGIFLYGGWGKQDQLVSAYGWGWSPWNTTLGTSIRTGSSANSPYLDGSDGIALGYAQTYSTTDGFVLFRHYDG